jgi:hypothetical protein
MNSIATPKAIERHDALIARADEQLAKMEHDCARPPSAGAGLQSSLKRPRSGALVGLPLAACIVVAALLLQSSHGGEARLVVARSAPQLVSTPSLLPENSQLPAQPAPSAVQVAPVEATRPQATPLAQAAPQQAAPTAPEPVPDQTQLLQTIARGLAKVERDIEELKASQDEMKRELAKVSEQNPSKTPPPPTQQAPASRKPERTLPHARGRTPREDWYYSDWW